MSQFDVSTYRGLCRCHRDSLVSLRPSNTLPSWRQQGGGLSPLLKVKVLAVTSSSNVFTPAITSTAMLLGSLQFGPLRDQPFSILIMKSLVEVNQAILAWSLKGHCHEMVIEMRLWSSRFRPKLRFANPFFRLKIGRFKARVC
jgi:hypothetical protein